MVRQIQHLNRAFTTLDGDITDAATSITLTDGSVFPADGDYNLRIGDEIVLVTARASDVLTVVRGVESSTATAHSDLDYVFPLLTGQAMNSWVQEKYQSGHSDVVLPDRLQATNGDTLTSTDFTWVNQGGATVVDHDSGGMTIVAAAGAGFAHRQLYRTLTDPYTVTAHVRYPPGNGSGTSSSNMIVSVGWRESSSGKLSMVSIRTILQWWNWSSSSSYNSNTTAKTVEFLWRRDCWIRLTHDGTDLTTEVSFNGINFFELGSETIGGGAYLDPDQVGFMVSGGSATLDRPATLLAWHEDET